MGVFPKIQSPCPYKGALADIMDGDICRLCKREVIDLNPLSDRERMAFLASCSDEVCVSYSFPLRPALAAAIAVTALGAPMAAAADEFEVEEEMVIVGGITDPQNVQYVADPRDDEAPELPVVYDDQEPKADIEADASRTGADLSEPVEEE